MRVSLPESVRGVFLVLLGSARSAGYARFRLWTFLNCFGHYGTGASWI